VRTEIRIVVGHNDAGDAVHVDVGQHGVVVARRELAGATSIDFLASVVSVALTG
jgi:hypothetical protein